LSDVRHSACAPLDTTPLGLVLTSPSPCVGWQVPGVCTHAATAFRNVCARCSSRLQVGASLRCLTRATSATAVCHLTTPGLHPPALQDAATLAPLIDHTESCVPQPGQPGLSLDDRSAVVQGLARVVATLPPPECAAAGARLLVRCTAVKKLRIVRLGLGTS
jgi:hypothetical protein